MKKVGIITLNGYFNYGNRLQNYALQEVLKKLDCNVETIRFEKTPQKRGNLYKSIRSMYRLVQLKLGTDDQKSELKREKILLDFSQKNIHETNKTYHINDDLENLNHHYDYCVIGSDQVWNPLMNAESGKYFGQFVNKNKRIAYSPSFGLSELPERTKKTYKDWIETIPYLSVREEAGSRIIETLTGSKAPVLADPTMLLTKNEWLSISNRAKNRPNTPYLLTYFLGGPSKETREELKKIAQKNNMKIINLGDKNERETYETGPSEFLDYINNASAFFTDSFHGVVFSIIFQTPFVVYERKSTGQSMYSRIETILDNFDMRNREANGFNEDVFSMDFSGTHEVLEREYNKSIDYLKEALRIEG